MWKSGGNQDYWQKYHLSKWFLWISNIGMETKVLLLKFHSRANGVKPKNSGELLKYVQELYPDLLLKYYDEIKKEWLYKFDSI